MVEGIGAAAQQLSSAQQQMLECLTNGYALDPHPVARKVVAFKGRSWRSFSVRTFNALVKGGLVQGSGTAWCVTEVGVQALAEQRRLP